MKKKDVTTHTDESSAGLVNADPAHAPGKHHLNLEEVATDLPPGDPGEYERRIPVENWLVRKARQLRGR